MSIVLTSPEGARLEMKPSITMERARELCATLGDQTQDVRVRLAAASELARHLEPVTATLVLEHPAYTAKMTGVRAPGESE